MAAIPAWTPSRLGTRTATRSRTTVALAFNWREAVNLAGLFALIAMVTYFASSLVGHMLFETTRQRGIEAKNRAQQAVIHEVILKRKLAQLTAANHVEAWGRERGYLTIEQVGANVADAFRAPVASSVLTSHDANAPSQTSGENEHGSRAP